MIFWTSVYWFVCSFYFFFFKFIQPNLEIIKTIFRGGQEIFWLFIIIHHYRYIERTILNKLPTPSPRSRRSQVNYVFIIEPITNHSFPFLSFLNGSSYEWFYLSFLFFRLCRKFLWALLNGGRLRTELP